MSLYRVAVIVLFLFSWMPASSAEPPRAGGSKVALFDGSSLDGWEKYGGAAPFEARNGEIVGTAIEEKTNTFLATKEEYRDFVLDLDFKIDGGNSGIQFRSHVRPEGGIQRVFGYQAEIDPGDPSKIGGIYEEGARGWICDLRKTALGKKASEAFRPGEWNHYRIEAHGDRIRTWLNDAPIADFHDSQTESGFIALQVHAVGKSEGKTVHFKNITLQKLDEK